MVVCFDTVESISINYLFIKTNLSSNTATTEVPLCSFCDMVMDKTLAGLQDSPFAAAATTRFSDRVTAKRVG